MIEVTGDLWTYTPISEPLIVRCITTNATIKKDGRVVMGRGVAYQASQRVPTLPLALGEHIRVKGNSVMGPIKLYGIQGRWIGNSKAYHLLTFPVKHNWWEDADIALIRRSAEQLDKIARGMRERVFVLPRPGIGNGHLSWKVVRHWLVNLPDNVHTISRESDSGQNSK